jgi:hypothetical protein
MPMPTIERIANARPRYAAGTASLIAVDRTDESPSAVKPYSPANASNGTADSWLDQPKPNEQSAPTAATTINTVRRP